jgi:hypothetical protein
MKAFQDKITGLWKWGLYGEFKYSTKDECQQNEMKLLIQRLKAIREECQNSKIPISL